MSTRITVSFIEGDYSIYPDTPNNSLSLSPRNAAIAASVVSILLNRASWEDMSDSQWDVLEERISEILYQLEGAI